MGKLRTGWERFSLTHKWQREVLRGEVEEKNKMAGEASQEWPPTHDEREKLKKKKKKKGNKIKVRLIFLPFWLSPGSFHPQRGFKWRVYPFLWISQSWRQDMIPQLRHI